MAFSKALRRRIVREHAAANGGVFDPAVFLSEAGAADHPAHDWFNWDDEAAAHAHRLQQARNFASALRIRVVVNDVTRGPVTITVPLVISPVAHRDGQYVLMDENRLPALRDEAARALEAWLRRFSGAASSAGVTDAEIDALVARLDADVAAIGQAA